MENQPKDFNEFLDSMLICVAEHQTNSSNQSSDLYEICRSESWSVPDTWIQQAARELQSRRLGMSVSGPSEANFGMNSAGLVEASRLKTLRSPSITDVLVSDKVQKIGSLGVSIVSLVISLAALFVAILAFQKA